MSSLTIKRMKTISQEAEFTFTVRELAEKFTDDQLREAGLFRDLRDADIARRDEIERLESQARCACDEDDCDCACHDVRRRREQCSAAPISPVSERNFWPIVRAFAIRGDLSNVIHELENRAWSYGATTIDFNRALAPKA